MASRLAPSNPKGDGTVLRGRFRAAALSATALSATALLATALLVEAISRQAPGQNGAIASYRKQAIARKRSASKVA